MRKEPILISGEMVPRPRPDIRGFSLEKAAAKRNVSASLFRADSRNDSIPLRNQGWTRSRYSENPPRLGKNSQEKTPARFPFQHEAGPGKK